METSFSRSSFLIVFSVATDPSTSFLSKPPRQGETVWCLQPNFPPAPLNTIWESTLLIESPDVCVLLVFVSFWICSFSSDLLCLCHGIAHASKLHTAQQKAQESYLDKSMLQVGMTEPSLLVFMQVELSHSHRYAKMGCITPFPDSLK